MVNQEGMGQCSGFGAPVALRSASPWLLLPLLCSWMRTPSTPTRLASLLSRSDCSFVPALRGVRRRRPRPLLKEGFQGWPPEAEGNPLVDLGHRGHFKAGEQIPYGLPQGVLALLLSPRLLEQRVALLLHLIDQERQHHQQGKHHRQMLVAVP